MFTSHSGRFTTWKKAHRTHWMWCWVDLRPSQKASGKKNFSVSCRKLKENCLVVHHVTSTLTQT